MSQYKKLQNTWNSHTGNYLPTDPCNILGHTNTHSSNLSYSQFPDFSNIDIINQYNTSIAECTKYKNYLNNFDSNDKVGTVDGKDLYLNEWRTDDEKKWGLGCRAEDGITDIPCCFSDNNALTLPSGGSTCDPNNPDVKNCNLTCIKSSQPTFNCVANQCKDPGDGTGIYPNLTICQEECTPPTYNCYQSWSNGSGEMSRDCQVVPSGEPLGDYATFDACKRACTGANAKDCEDAKDDEWCGTCSSSFSGENCKWKCGSSGWGRTYNPGGTAAGSRSYMTVEENGNINTYTWDKSGTECWTHACSCYPKTEGKYPSP